MDAAGNEMQGPTEDDAEGGVGVDADANDGETDTVVGEDKSEVRRVPPGGGGPQ